MYYIIYYIKFFCSGRRKLQEIGFTKRQETVKQNLNFKRKILRKINSTDLPYDQRQLPMNTFYGVVVSGSDPN